MKRLVYSKSTYNENTDFLEIEIDVTYSLVTLQCSSLMDINDPEFHEFEDSLLDILDMHDFNLEDAYQSDRKSSISQYYILTKTNEEGTRLRVFVKLRVSDHVVGTKTFRGKETTYRQRDDKYIHDEARQFAKDHFNQSRGYKPRHIEIILDGEHCSSYEEALTRIETRLEEFDPE